MSISVIRRALLVFRGNFGRPLRSAPIQLGVMSLCKRTRSSRNPDNGDHHRLPIIMLQFRKNYQLLDFRKESAQPPPFTRNGVYDHCHHTSRHQGPVGRDAESIQLRKLKLLGDAQFLVCPAAVLFYDQIQLVKVTPTFRIDVDQERTQFLEVQAPCRFNRP